MASRSAARAKPIRPGGAGTASTAPCCSELAPRLSVAARAGAAEHSGLCRRAAGVLGRMQRRNRSRTAFPHALTDETFVLDGQTIPNPLRSFTLPVAIVDQVKNDPIVYSKPAGYETVRYPLSGLLGTPADQAATAAHNAQFPNYQDNVGYLNDNVATWLSGKIRVGGQWVGEVESQFVQCLNAPNYTLFSNTTSAGARTQPATCAARTAAQHDASRGRRLRLSRPGRSLAHPGRERRHGRKRHRRARSHFLLPPLLHRLHVLDLAASAQFTKAFTIDSSDPGAQYSSSNPPPADADPNAPMSLTTPLNPFKTANGGAAMTTADVIDIENQLGYTYGPGSLDQYATPAAAHPMALRRRRPATRLRSAASTAPTSAARSSSRLSRRSMASASISAPKRCSAAGMSRAA